LLRAPDNSDYVSEEETLILVSAATLLSAFSVPAFGVRRLAFGGRLVFGVWGLGVGGWGLGVGIRRLAFGGCGAQEALAQEGEAAGRVRLRPNRGSRLAAPDNVTPTKSSSGLFENKDEDV
jgi:hypothetical protein